MIKGGNDGGRTTGHVTNRDCQACVKSFWDLWHSKTCFASSSMVLRPLPKEWMKTTSWTSASSVHAKRHDTRTLLERKFFPMGVIVVEIHTGFPKRCFAYRDIFKYFVGKEWPTRVQEKHHFMNNATFEKRSVSHELSDECYSAIMLLYDTSATYDTSAKHECYNSNVWDWGWRSMKWKNKREPPSSPASQQPVPQPPAAAQ